MASYYSEKPGILSIRLFPRFEPEKGGLGYYSAKIPAPVHGVLVGLGVFLLLYLYTVHRYEDIPGYVYYGAGLAGFLALIVVLGIRQDDINAILFNYEEGIVSEIKTGGRRVDHGVFAEIDRIALRVTREIGATSHNYVILWKDRLRPVLPISPNVYKPERLAQFRDEIAPRLKEILDEYRETHSEEGEIFRSPPVSLDAQTVNQREEFFRSEGGSFYRYTLVELFIFSFVSVGFAVWAFLGGYGVAGTTLLSACFLGSLVLLFYVDEILVISQHNRTLGVVGGFGMRQREFGFERVQCLAVMRMLGLVVASLILDDGEGVTLCATFDMDKALKVAEETGRLLGVDAYEMIMVE